MNGILNIYYFLLLKSQMHSLTGRLEKPKKIIIDTDAGGDDALAILLALKYEALHNREIAIIAITCTHGNTEEKNVELNVLKILTIAERNDVSHIYKQNNTQ